MVTIKVICPTGDDFSAKYLDEFPNGGFFVPTRLRAKQGTPVMLSLRIGSRATPVLLRASVRWTRPGKVIHRIRGGVGLEFLPSETPALNHLLSLARRNGDPNWARRHQRIPIAIPIRWSVRGAPQQRSGLLQDISFGGASARTKEWLAERSEILVTAALPGAAAAMTLAARVVWTLPGVAFGVSWRARDPGGSRRIKELVRRLEQVSEDRETHDVVREP